MKRVITNDELIPQLQDLYYVQGLPDASIAYLLGVDRTNVVKMRKEFQIETRQETGRIGLDIAEDKLLSFGLKVENKRKENGIHPYDLLVNDNIRIEVMSSKIDPKTRIAKFTLTNKPEAGLIESDIRIRLDNGRTRKLYYKTCDFILMVGVGENYNHFWILPSSAVGDTMQSISMCLGTGRSKYNCYQDAWGLIGSAIDGYGKDVVCM